MTQRIIDTFYLLYDKESLLQKDFIIKCLEDLSAYIKALFGLNYTFNELPDGYKANIYTILEQMNDFADTSGKITAFFLKQFCDRTANLIVFCGPNSNIKKVAIHGNSVALRGCACGRLSAIYNLNKQTIWHETLHLFGAEDCYETSNPSLTICNNFNCIMQYDPSNDSIDLCEKNMKILTNSFKD